jgi:hypothetical protein
VATQFEIEKGPFEPTWESLRQFECPDWFRDAKLGIWAHWGPQCLPMYGDWYARGIYIEGSDQYRYHWRVYGHPSKFGYKDIVKLWKAERFDPEGLMDLYVKAGARYFVAQAAHHDNFDNWDSKHNRWNAVKVGPEKNIVELWQEAAKKRGLPFGLTEHLGATFSWWCLNKGADKTGPYAGVPYDGNDPEFEDFYLPNRDEIRPDGSRAPWYTANPWWHERWFNRIKDAIDQHQPDLLYSDGGVPFYRPGDDVRCEAAGLHAIAHLYNTSAKLNGGVNRAVYNQKDRDPDVHTVGVLDIERGAQADIYPHPWQQRAPEVQDAEARDRDAGRHRLEERQPAVEPPAEARRHARRGMPSHPGVHGRLDRGERRGRLRDPAVEGRGRRADHGRGRQVQGGGARVDARRLPLHVQGQCRLRVPDEVAREGQGPREEPREGSRSEGRGRPAPRPRR